MKRQMVLNLHSGPVTKAFETGFAHMRQALSTHCLPKRPLNLDCDNNSRYQYYFSRSSDLMSNGFPSPQYANAIILDSTLSGNFHLVDDSTSYPSCTYRCFLSSLHASLLNFGLALDAVQFGPYQFQNCKANNNNIYTLLITLRQTLQLGITDLGSSTSSDAYNTFFKDIANAPYVREVFSNIIKGASVPPEPGIPSSAPLFICVDGRDQVTFNENNRQVDAYTRCHTLGETPAMALLTTPYLVICPVFFTHPAIPLQSTASCLDVDPRRSRFVQDGKSLIKYQMWHILHELVHYYVYSTKGRHLDVYGINACLALRSAYAVLNAQSYTYYIASEWITQLSRLCSPYALHLR